MYRFPYRRLPRKASAPPPVEPADAPVEPADAPVEPAAAPVEPAAAPVEPADVPVEPAAPVPPPPIADTRPAATVALTRQRRLVNEYRKVCQDSELRDHLKLLTKDLGVWYFMIKSDEGCESIFKVKHADNYPFGPPVISCLTKNGVFQPGTTLCTSFTHYHPEQWDASMTTEKMFIGMTAYYNLVSEGKDRGVGVSLATEAERKTLAPLSADYNKKFIEKEVHELFYYEGSPWGGCTPLTLPGAK